MIILILNKTGSNVIINVKSIYLKKKKKANIYKYNFI